MAARQDQTLQIFLIVFAFLVVVLGALTYLFYKSSSDAQQQVAGLRQQLDSSENAVRTQRSEIENYLGFIGVNTADNPADIQATFQEDMTRYGSNLDENSRSYRALVESLYAESRAAAKREADNAQSLQQLQARIAAMEADKDKQISQFQQQLADAKNQAQADLQDFNTARARQVTENQRLQQTLDSSRQTSQAQIQSLEQRLSANDTQLQDTTRSLQNVLAERNRGVESFEVPDGNIVHVNQNGTVWINLGEADALRRQVTFSVYDAELADPTTATKKAAIEVTRVLDDHLAEAMVTDPDNLNPIMLGDKIYSQVWHRGDKLHFAITGLVDANDDGLNDMQQVRDLIELNGGVVDAYVKDDGTVEGEMSVLTRYLILGEHPMAAHQENLRQGWDQMNSSANQLGVEVILLSEFLNRMGYAQTDRTVRLGTAARSTDFRVTPGGSTQPTTSGDGASTFRPRSPYRPPIRVPY